MARKDSSSTLSDAAFPLIPEWRTPAQRDLAALYDEVDLLLVLGPSGCGKTFVPTAMAVRDVLSRRRKKLVVLRPAVEAGPSIGFIPGTLEEKLEPFLAPVREALGKNAKLPPGSVELASLGHAQGRTFEDCVVLLDEAQNASLDQLRLVLTRMGRNCKMVVCGDPGQSYVRPTQPSHASDLDYVADRLAGTPGIGVFDFHEDDCVRHPLVKQVLRLL